MAMCPPLRRHSSATMWKFFHSSRKTAQWALIFLRVAGLLCQLMHCHIDPPVHGRAPNSKVGRSESETANIALARPAADVMSSLIVNLMTSQSGGAMLPISESLPQQNSTIRRLMRTALAISLRW